MQDIEKKNTRLPIGQSLLLALSLMFFMSFSVCTEVVIYRYMVVAVFALLLFIAVRSRLVLLLSALPCLLALIGAATSADLPLLLSAVAIIGFGGFGIGAMHPLSLPAAPVFSYLLALVLTGDPIASLSVLTFLPLAAILALTLHFKLSRTASVAALSAAILVYAAPVFLLALPEGVSLSPETFANTVKEFRTLLTDEIMNMITDEEFSSLLGNVSRDTVSAMIGLTLQLLPAILIITAEIFAYFACLIAVTLKAARQSLPELTLAFRMSAVSAILFLASFLFSLLPLGEGDAAGVFGLTAMNLYLILLPGLAVCGALHVISLIRQKRILSPIFFIILLIWFWSMIPTLLAFVGAFAVLRSEKKFKKTNEGQH